LGHAAQDAPGSLKADVLPGHDAAHFSGQFDIIILIVFDFDIFKILICFVVDLCHL
jgi:hypothetical protein